MLRIGEFSVLSSISINMLRHYDKIGLLVPEHVDCVSGYRYYDTEQLVQANRIVALKAMGFALNEIKEANLMNQVQFEHLLQEKLKSKQDEAKLVQNQIMRINEAIKLKDENEKYTLSIITKIVPPMWVVSYRGKINEFKEEGLLWSKLMEECEKQGIKVSASSVAMAINHEIKYEKNGLDVEVRLSIEKEQKCLGDIKNYKMPATKIASLIFQGSYGQIASINSFVAKWLDDNQFEISGKVFSIYHNSPRESRAEENFITELCFPIVKK